MVATTICNDIMAMIGDEVKAIQERAKMATKIQKRIRGCFLRNKLLASLHNTNVCLNPQWPQCYRHAYNMYVGDVAWGGADRGRLAYLLSRNEFRMAAMIRSMKLSVFKTTDACIEDRGQRFNRRRRAPNAPRDVDALW